MQSRATGIADHMLPLGDLLILEKPEKNWDLTVLSLKCGYPLNKGATLRWDSTEPVNQLQRS